MQEWPSARQGRLQHITRSPLVSSSRLVVQDAPFRLRRMCTAWRPLLLGFCPHPREHGGSKGRLPLEETARAAPCSLIVPQGAFGRIPAARPLYHAKGASFSLFTPLLLSTTTIYTCPSRVSATPTHIYPSPAWHGHHRNLSLVRQLCEPPRHG